MIDELEWWHLSGHHNPAPSPAYRTGVIHSTPDRPEDADDSPFAEGEDAGDVPVLIRFGDHTVPGRLLGAGWEGGDLVAAFAWPAEIEDLVADSTPEAHCHWDDDGNLAGVVILLDDEEDRFVSPDDMDDEERELFGLPAKDRETYAQAGRRIGEAVAAALKPAVERIRYAAAHAPKTMTVHGKVYKGGQFIPGDHAPDSLEHFADAVHASTTTSPAGWYGDRKVFINHVRAGLKDHPTIGKMTPEAFGKRLLQAHQARLLELGRGDLLDKHPDDARDSATPHMGAVYHYVRTHGDRPRASAADPEPRQAPPPASIATQAGPIETPASPEVAYSLENLRDLAGSTRRNDAGAVDRLMKGIGQHSARDLADLHRRFVGRDGGKSKAENLASIRARIAAS